MELHRPVRHHLRYLVDRQRRGRAVRVPQRGRRAGGGEGGVAGQSRVMIARVAPIGAVRDGRGRAARGGVGIEVAERVGLHDFQPVKRPAVDLVRRQEVGDLLRVDVINEQPASTGRRERGMEPHLAVIVNHRAVGLHRLAVLEQEILTARVRAHHGDVERRVGGRRCAEAVGVVGRERDDGHPSQLAERPRIHARGAQGGGVVAAPHQAELPYPFALVARVVQVGEPESVPRLVRDGPDRHDLGGIAAVLAPDAALERVIRDDDPPAERVARVRRVGPRRQDIPVRPEVIVGNAATLPPLRRVNEHHEVDDAVTIGVVLPPVDQVVDLAQRFHQP